MKRLLTILAVLIISINGFSQSIVPRANSSYTVMDSRFMAQYNLFVPRFADTTAANLQKGIDSLGAVIFTYDNMSLMVRSGSPKVWTEIGSGSGGTWGTITGTLSDQTDLQNALNLKAPLASPTFTGTVTTPLTASRAVVTGASSELAISATTATEIGYVNGVTSAIQTQLNNKQPLDADLTTIAGLTATTNNFIVSSASAWASQTPAQVNAILPVFTSTLNGLTPLSGGGTTNFLRADGTWTDPTTSNAANKALSNLASVAINTSLISNANNAYDLGSTSLAWRAIYSYDLALKGATSGEINLVAAPVAGTTIATLPAGSPTSSYTLAQITNPQTFSNSQTFTGLVNLSGGIITNSVGGASSNFNVTGSTGSGSSAVAQIGLLGATTGSYRVGSRGTTNATPPAGASYAHFLIGDMAILEPTTSVTPIMAVIGARAGTVINAGGSTDYLVGMYMEGPPTGITPNISSYGLWIDAGLSRFDGSVLQGQGADVASANNLVLGNDGNSFEITGTTQVNLISNIGFQNGTVINLLFTSTPTVKNNQATSTTNITIQLAGAADFSATAGDVLTLVLSEIGGTQAWREVSRSIN